MTPLISFFSRRYTIPLTLFLLALATRLAWLGHPSGTVFDEVYFREFTADYLSGSYFFDIHPPLGKLLLAGWAALLGYNPQEVISAPATYLRFLPAIAGAAIIPVFYLTLRNLNLRKRWATVGAVCLLLDGALIVQSKFILLDSLLILFGIMGLWLFTLSVRRPKFELIYLSLAGLFLGMAGSIKWTGWGVLMAVGATWLYRCVTGRKVPSLTQLTGAFLALIVIPAAVYVGSFYVHFSLLTNSGTGDAFMSTRFQSTLNGNTTGLSQQKVLFAEKFISLNQIMYKSNSGLKSHPYQSKWYSWPLLQRPILYWISPLQSGKIGYIYLLGNPLVWWASSLAVIFAVMIVLARRIVPERLHLATALLLIMYAANWLPFAGITRPMFLYHYLLALTASVGILVIVLDTATARMENGGRSVAISVCGAALASFLFFAPLTYGIPLTNAAFHLRLWFSSWL